MLQPIQRFLLRVGRLVLLDRAADPAANGEIQRNATHVKVYSGGAVRNLSDVGGSTAHAAAHQPAGSDAMAVDAAAATGSLRTLGTTALKAAAGDHTHAGGGAETSAQADVATTESTTSTSYTDLATAGPAVTLSPGSTQNHLIWAGFFGYNASASYIAFMSLTVAGAAAIDADAAANRDTNGSNVMRAIYAASVANGASHTAKYRSENAAGTANFAQRRIVATTT